MILSFKTIDVTTAVTKFWKVQSIKYYIFGVIPKFKICREIDYWYRIREDKGIVQFWQQRGGMISVK